MEITIPKVWEGKNPIDLRGTCHIITGKKGGTGKTFICSALVEAMRLGLDDGSLVMPSDSSEFRVFDADPSNFSLSQIVGLGAVRVDIFTPTRDLKNSELDRIFMPSESPEEIRIVDIGSTGYEEILQYIKESDILSTWQEYGKRIFFHSPLCGGDLLSGTLRAIGEIMEIFPEAELFVWVNDYDKTDDGSGVISVQKYFDMEVENFKQRKNKELPSIREAFAIEDKISVSGLTQEAASAVFQNIFYRTKKMSRVINFANASVSGLKFIRPTIKSVKQDKKTFTEFLSSDKVSFGDRQRIKTYLFKEGCGVFREIMTILSGISLTPVDIQDEPEYSNQIGLENTTNE